MLQSINLALNTTEDNSWNFLKKHYAENPMTDRLFGLPGAVLEVDIRNKNDYISRTYEEEINFEIRSKILNPLYYNELFNTRAGALSYAAQMQNLYGVLIVSNTKLNTQLGNDIANTYLGLASGVGNVAQAAAWQSIAAWMMYLSYQGMWDGNQELVTELADNMIKIANIYGVACCHHTCKNLDFNMKLIQSSSLSASEKAKYAQILSQATLTDPIYEDDNNIDNTNPDDSNTDNTNSDDSNNQVLVNRTTNDQSSSGESAGSATAVGAYTSIKSGDAKSAASQSSSKSSQADSSSQDASGGASAHEISKSSASKSAAGQSSTPVVLIIAVICLIAIFVVGYARNKRENDKYDY